MTSEMNLTQRAQFGKPTGAFVGASWAALVLGASVYTVSFLLVDVEPLERGFLLGAFFFGIVGPIGVQKLVRDRHEGVSVTSLGLGVSWFGPVIGIAMLAWGLWNSGRPPSESGLFGMAFAMTVFANMVVQKNTSDLITLKAQHPETYGESIGTGKQTAQRRPGSED